MFTEQKISPNLVEELRTEAGVSHGDGAEESVECRAADRLLEAHVILQTWVNLSADLSADQLPKPLREIQDDEQALLIRAQEWCRKMGPVTPAEAAHFRAISAQTGRAVVSIAERIRALSRVNDLDGLLLGLDCLRDEVRDLIASKDAAFIDGVLGTRRDRPTNEELAR